MPRTARTPNDSAKAPQKSLNRIPSTVLTDVMFEVFSYLGPDNMARFPYQMIWTLSETNKTFTTLLIHFLNLSPEIQKKYFFSGRDTSKHPEFKLKSEDVECLTKYGSTYGLNIRIVWHL